MEVEENFGFAKSTGLLLYLEDVFTSYQIIWMIYPLKNVNYHQSQLMGTFSKSQFITWKPSI